jgi:hypothetical protein
MELFVFSILLWIAISLFIGLAFSERKIGFCGVCLRSLLLSPIVGLIVGLMSPKKELNDGNSVKNRLILSADDLIKLRDLADKNVITEEEYQQQKKKLLSI